MNTSEEKRLRQCLELVLAHQWLQNGEHMEALIALMNLCQSAEHEELIVDLLRRFKYLYSADYEGALDQISAKAKSLAADRQETTVIAAISMDSKPDSSQIVAYSLKTKLPLHGWQGARIVSRLDRVYKKSKIGEVAPAPVEHVILVDEFVGSGQTILNKIKFLRRRSAELKLPEPAISALVVAGMNFALKKIADDGVYIFAAHSLSKGISEHFVEAEAESKRQLMLQLEDLLDPKCDEEDLPSMGYGQAEALFARELGNTPNSVFPIYWWRHLRGNIARRTLLRRA